MLDDWPRFLSELDTRLGFSGAGMDCITAAQTILLLYCAMLTEVMSQRLNTQSIYVVLHVTVWTSSAHNGLYVITQASKSRITEYS